MYTFKDTNNHQQDSYSRPSEAVKINGVWLDGNVPGYQTLNVQGRELMQSEVESVKIGQSNGTQFKYKTHTERVITVTYQLVADSNANFRNAWQTLNQYLDVEQVEIIFQDEVSKFYIGTPVNSEQVEPGRNSVVGQFQIICNDPYKYSTFLYQRPLTDQNTNMAERTFDYNGTVICQPEFRVNMFNSELSHDYRGDSQYLRFYNRAAYRGTTFNRDILFGDRNAPQPSPTPTTENLLNRTFNNSDSSKLSGFNLYSDLWRTDWHSQGSMAVSTNNTIPNYGNATTDRYGPGYRYIISDSKQYDVGFELEVNCIFDLSHASSSDKGTTFVGVSDALGNTIAGAYIQESDGGASTANIDLVIGNSTHIVRVMQSSAYGCLITITKENQNVTIKVKPNNSTESTYSTTTSSTAYPRNIDIVNLRTQASNPIGQGFISLSFDGIYSSKDGANFKTNDLFTVNCSSVDIRLNGQKRPDLGYITNQYDKFYLVPGSNRIRCYWNTWTEEHPSVQIWYREVFL